MEEHLRHPSGTEQGHPLPSLSFKIEPELKKKSGKEKKGAQTGKEAKVSLFADNVTLHIRNCKDSTRKFLELMFFLYKVEDYKAIVLKSAVTFLPTKIAHWKKNQGNNPIHNSLKKKGRIPWDKPSQGYKVPNMNTLKY